MTLPEVDGRDEELVGGFEAFYARHYRPAVRLAFVLTGDPTAAEDVAQEAFVRVRAKYASLREPWPYTRAAVVNATRTAARRTRRERTRLELVGSAAPAVAGLGAHELLDAIDALPHRQKAVIVLRYYEDLSEREIAEVLGCRPGTVKSLASRALARLAEEIRR